MLTYFLAVKSLNFFFIIKVTIKVLFFMPFFSMAHQGCPVAISFFKCKHYFFTTLYFINFSVNVSKSKLERRFFEIL